MLRQAVTRRERHRPGHLNDVEEEPVRTATAPPPACAPGIVEVGSPSLRFCAEAAG